MPTRINPFISQVLTDARMVFAIRQWQSFERSILDDDRIGVVYHGDLDGLIGAAYIGALLKYHLPFSANTLLFWISTDEYDFSSLKKWIAENNLDKCVFLDIPLENHNEALEFISKEVKDNIFIYDHHVVHSHPIELHNVTIVNPSPHGVAQSEKPLPTFMFAYSIAIDKNIYFPEWLLLLSIFAEGVETFFVSETRNLFQSAMGMCVHGSPRDTYRNSLLIKISSLIRAGFASKEKSNVILYMLHDVMTEMYVSPESFHQALARVFQPISNEISTMISSVVDYWKDAINTSELKHEKLIVIELDHPEYSIAGPVASIIRGAFPDKVIAVYDLRDETVVIEIRIQNESTLNLVQVLDKIASQLTLINYGGHTSAAGALVSKDDLKSFLNIFEQELLSNGT